MLIKKNNYMHNITLDNLDNDKRLKIQLPIVPRIGDWIDVCYEDEFTNHESFLIVKNVLLSRSEIIVIVQRFD